jgi:hypothetical protein
METQKQIKEKYSKVNENIYTICAKIFIHQPAIMIYLYRRDIKTLICCKAYNQGNLTDEIPILFENHIHTVI